MTVTVLRLKVMLKTIKFGPTIKPDPKLRKVYLRDAFA